MFRLCYRHKNKRQLAWSVIAISLFLVSLGIRVPHLTLLHSSPKPNPRAILETASKASKPTISKSAIAKHDISVELFKSVPELPAPKLFPLRFLTVAYRFNTSLPPQISARAPPVYAS
jgi:hypothetical protein